MTTYLVTYTAQYQVTANTPDQAIAKAIDEHEQLPDGIWEPEQIYTTTYTITESQRNEKV
jgi:hypothetical protein